MRNFFILLIILMTIFSCKFENHEPEKQNQPGNKLQANIAFDAVRLRKEPGIESEIIMTLKKDQVVDILQKTDKKVKLSGYPEDYWYEVSSSDGQKGWVFGALMEISIIPVNEKKTVEKTPDIKTEKYTWKTESAQKITSGLIDAGGLVIYGKSDNVIYAIEKTSGKTTWKVPMKDAIKEITLSGEGQLIAVTPGRITLISGDKGTIKWNFKTGKEITSNVISSKGSAYFCDSDSVVSIVDIKTGKKTGTIKIENPGISLMISGELLFITDKNNAIYSIDVTKTKEK